MYLSTAIGAMRASSRGSGWMASQLVQRRWFIWLQFFSSNFRRRSGDSTGRNKGRESEREIEREAAKKRTKAERLGDTYEGKTNINKIDVIRFDRIPYWTNHTAASAGIRCQVEHTLSLYTRREQYNQRLHHLYGTNEPSSTSHTYARARLNLFIGL